MNNNNIYFPCILVEHNKNEYSVISSDFHYFDDYFVDKEAGGYAIEKLAKKLAKENNITKGIEFDSEAGMFCAFSKDKDKLLQLCNLLKEITGEEDQYKTDKEIKPLIALDKAEKLLLKGFVLSLDKDAQKAFLEGVPMPSLNKRQTAYISALKNGTDKEKINALKRINSEARTKTRSWDHYLSHPKTITLFLKSIDKEENIKVYQELIWALVFICGRHLPDLRTQAYFLNALKSKTGTIRWLGIMGLNKIYSFPFKNMMPLLTDKAYKVRGKMVSMIRFTDREFPIWMFHPIQSKKNNVPKDISLFFPLFNDKHRSVLIDALETLLKLKEEQLFPKLKELIPSYKKLLLPEETPYFTDLIKKVIERLEKI